MDVPGVPTERVQGDAVDLDARLELVPPGGVEEEAVVPLDAQPSLLPPVRPSVGGDIPEPPQRLNPVRVGEEPVEQHKLDLELEFEAVERLNQAIALCRDAADNGTRELLEDILTNEEEGVDWLEAQLHPVEEVGKERYLAEQINS